MKLILFILAMLVLAVLLMPILHLLAFAFVAVGAVIVVLAACKVLFGGSGVTSIGQDRGGPPALH